MFIVLCLLPFSHAMSAFVLFNPGSIVLCFFLSKLVLHLVYVYVDPVFELRVRCSEEKYIMVVVNIREDFFAFDCELHKF